MPNGGGVRGGFGKRPHFFRIFICATFPYLFCVFFFGMDVNCIFSGFGHQCPYKWITETDLISKNYLWCCYWLQYLFDVKIYFAFVVNHDHIFIINLSLDVLLGGLQKCATFMCSGHTFWRWMVTMDFDGISLQKLG